jgi:hypothetical protein
MKKETWRHLIVYGGSVGCLAIAAVGMARIFYWHQATGDWLDEHILFWQPRLLACMGGVFFCTRMIDHLFEIL